MSGNEVNLRFRSRYFLPMLGVMMLTGIVLPARAQAPGTTAPVDKQPYLLRVGRVDGEAHSCVLLQRDGDYHMERDSGEKAEIDEGSLSKDELASLQRLLDDERLQKLTREEIAVPVAVPEQETWQFNIFRGDHWQNLPFESTESMKPVHATLAPLLEWFNTLHDAPHRTIPEDSGKNNCLPPRTIAFAARPEEPAIPAGKASGKSTEATANGETSQPPPSYLVRVIEQHFDRSEADSDCAVVYSNGAYRVEHSSQPWGGRIKSKIYQSTVNGAQLAELRALVDESHLKAVNEGNLPDEYYRHSQLGEMQSDAKFLLSSVTLVWIPRENAVQNLAFATDLMELTAIGNHQPVSDKNAKYIRPLVKWVKKALPADKGQLVKDAVPNSCAAK